MPRKGQGRIMGRPRTNEVPQPAGGVRMETFVPWTLVKRGAKKHAITPIDAPEAFRVEAVQPRHAEEETAALRALGLAYYWQHLRRSTRKSRERQRTSGVRRPPRSRRAGCFVGVRTAARVETKQKANDTASSHLRKPWRSVSRRDRRSRGGRRTNAGRRRQSVSPIFCSWGRLGCPVRFRKKWRHNPGNRQGRIFKRDRRSRRHGSRAGQPDGAVDVGGTGGGRRDDLSPASTLARKIRRTALPRCVS